VTETWLRLDQRENAIDDLAMCYRFLTEVGSESRWKWAIIALHQALYGFCICAVQGTDALSVLKDPANPSSQLISIHEALKRAKDKTYLWPGATPLSTTPAEDKALDKVIREFQTASRTSPCLAGQSRRPACPRFFDTSSASFAPSHWTPTQSGAIPRPNGRW